MFPLKEFKLKRAFSWALFYVTIHVIMHQQIVFSHKQNVFMIWAIEHLPLKFYEEKWGIIDDPYTKRHIAEVFYFDSSKFVANFIDFMIQYPLRDESARINEKKCIKFGYIKRNK